MTRKSEVVTKKSQLMAAKLAIKPIALSDAELSAMLKNIPFLTKLLRNTDNVGSSVTGLVQIDGNVSSAIRDTAQGFQFSGVAINAIDFIRIPSVYLFIALTKKKRNDNFPIKLTLTDRARWLYSSVLLGLSITAVVLPSTAIPMALTGSALGFSIGVYTLGHMFYRKRVVKRKIKDIDEQIINKTKVLNELQQKAEELEQKISDREKLTSPLTPFQESIKHSRDKSAEGDITSFSDSDISYHNDIDKWRHQLDETYKEFNILFDKKDSLQTLHNHKLQYEIELKSIKTAAVMNKSLALALATLGLAGLIVSIFFPVIGLGIIAGSAIFGGLYFVGQASASFISRNLSKLFSKKEVSAEPSDQLEHDSTCGILKSLENSATNPTNLNNEIKTNLEHIVEQKDVKGMLQYFANQHFSEVNDPESYASQEFNEFQKNDQAILLFKQAVDELNSGHVSLSDDDKDKLLSAVTYQPFNQFLHTQGIELNLQEAVNPLPPQLNAEDDKEIATMSSK